MLRTVGGVGREGGGLECCRVPLGWLTAAGPPQHTSNTRAIWAAVSASAAAARAWSTVQAITSPTWGGEGEGAHACWLRSLAGGPAGAQSGGFCCRARRPLRHPPTQPPTTCITHTHTHTHPLVIHKLALLRQERAVGLLADLHSAPIHHAVAPLRGGESKQQRQQAWGAAQRQPHATPAAALPAAKPHVRPVRTASAAPAAAAPARGRRSPPGPTRRHRTRSSGCPQTRLRTCICRGVEAGGVDGCDTPSPSTAARLLCQALPSHAQLTDPRCHI